ncbi:M36 family metallopeptidase [Prosthecobacter sp.]|uniref:M36 family metallopeptidase n=1 Tax=Prosthecobacter sp. TaxID=1965333 RepID=UPI0025D4E44E|nr:M36 family metallopeptidase [Prosthecobacter sp.]
MQKRLIPLLVSAGFLVVILLLSSSPEEIGKADDEGLSANPVPASLSKAETSQMSLRKDDGPLEDLDVRSKRVIPAGVDDKRAKAMESLRSEVSGVQVDFDPVTRTPKWIGSLAKLLTGPQESAAAKDADVPVRVFIDAHREVFGHGAESLDKARRVTDYSTQRGPSRKVVWHQQHEGIDIFEAVLQANLTTKSELINIGSQFVMQPESAVTGGSAPVVAVEQAVAAAGQNVGEKMTAESVRPMGPPAAQPDRRQQFRAAMLTDADAKLTWLPMNESSMRLAWDVTLTSRSRAEMYRVLVDAANGEVLVRQAMTAYISDASYRVFTAESPTPMSPGHEKPSSLQPLPVNRVLLTTPALNTTASPNGWINDGGNITSGNNTDAYTDTNADDAADLPRTTGTGRVFDFPYDLTQEPANFKDASVTQLFYWSNFMHDRMYELGFTEAAGNFQTDNFGRGGVGNDPVNSEAQDGSGTNNANFSTPVDGGRGRMQMYNWTSPTPDRDGSFEAEVVLHEYGHGVSNRLVGGPSVTISALSSRGMGEGWSDFYGQALTAQASDNPHGNWSRAAWSRYLTSGWYSDNYYYGARRYSYSTDMLKNPHTLKDIDPNQVDWHTSVPRNPTYAATQDATQVHYQGTVWCVALWDVRTNLILKHGFATGNERALFLVTEGMKYTAANPNFIQARDGILQAAMVNHPGDLGEVWTAFAKRGMGDGATAPASSTTTGIVEQYDVPDSLEISDRSGWNIEGNKGGPFSPSAKTLTLSNDGASTINWSSNPGVPWLSVSPASGSLAPGANVIVTVTTQANTVAPGFHSTNLVFTNAGTSFNQPVGVRLYVTPPVAVSFDLNSDPGWTTTGEWAYGTPGGNGGSAGGGAGNADPTGGATGSSVFGVNLAGNAATTVGGPFYLTSTPVNLSARRATRLRFKRWLNTNVLSSTRVTVEVSTDGTTWREVFVNPGTAITDNAWQTMEYDISSMADQQPAVQVRWSCRNVTASTAYSGWNIDDVEFLGEPTAQFSIAAAASAGEGDAPLTATLNLNLAQDADVTVNLVSSNPAAATVPASLTLLAGETSKTFTITPVDDSDLDGTQTTVITASTAVNIASGSHTLAVTDNETAVLTLTTPASVQEGTTAISGSLSVSTAPTQNVMVQLGAALSRLVVPASVLIPAGSAGPVSFTFDAADNLLAEGAQSVGLTASVPNWTPGTATVTVTDDETPLIVLTGPATAREGDGAQSYTVTVNTVQAADLTLNVSSSDPGELTVPPTVTIPAGQFSVSFDAAPQDDSDMDGAQNATLTASHAGYPDATRVVSIADNEVNAYTIATIGSPQKRNKPFNVVITARDINGAVITNHSGSVMLSATATGGPPPFTPGSAGGFVNGIATPVVTVTSTATAMTLTATDGAGVTGTSNSFDVEPVVHDSFVFSGLPASANVDTLFNATATAVDDQGGTVTSYADPTVVDILGSYLERTVGSNSTSTGTDKVHNTAAHDSRCQIIYTAAELGGAPKLVSALVMWRITTGGQVMLNYKLRLKHTTLDSFDGRSWEEDGWTTVFTSASYTASATGHTSLKPFAYDGVRNLMVDISFDNTTASSAGTLRQTPAATNRMLSGTSNSTHGDPTTWTAASGPVPVISNDLPTMSFYEARSLGAIPVSPVTFTSGVWSGQAVGPVGGSMWLRAIAPSGVTGLSNLVSISNPSTIVGTETVFSDGFETGVLGASWSTAGNSGATARTQVTTANTPKTGTYHLTMDTTSAVTGTFAANRPTLTLNLAGRKNVSLEWFAKSFADDGYSPILTGPLGTFGSTMNYDGVAISQDGLTWVEVSALRSLSSAYGTTATRVFLDPVIQRLGWSFNSTFQLRFSQYDDQAIPNDGIGIDDVAVKANPTTAIAVNLPPTITEGSLNQSVTVSLPAAAASNTSVTLTSNGPARLSIVSPVTILAGQTSASTTITAPQNNFADVGKGVIVTASASGQTTSYTHIRVVDDEQSVLTLALPASVTEGSSSAAGTVFIEPIQPVTTTVYLTSDNTAEATVSNFATIFAGARSGTFFITSVNDMLLDGTQSVTLTASGQGLAPASAPIDVLDNESTQLTVTPPATLTEGGAPGIGTVRISGQRSVDTVVMIASSDTTEATVPMNVTIPAGQVSVNFQVFPMEDSIQDGLQSVTLTASAAGFTDGTASADVRDDDPASFEFAGISSPQTRNVPFAITITAKDGTDNVLTGFHGTVNLSAISAGGALSVTPGISASFINGVWTGSVSLGGTGTGVTLTATGTDGATGTSDAFDVNPGGVAVSLALVPVSSPQVAGAVIPVHVSAVDANGVRVNETAGSVTVNLVTAPGGLLVASQSLTLVNGQASSSFVVSAGLASVRLEATAGALSGQSGVFAITTPDPLAYSPPQVVFSDDFEAAAFKPEWTITGTGTHRTIITTANGPRAGTRHMTMDSTTDVSDARNEATLTLNLAGKSDVELSFWMKESGDEDNGPPGSPFTGGADFDGVAISADGTTWHEVQGLRTADGIGTTYKQFKLNLSTAAAAHGLTPGAGFRIRFNHFDNYTYGTDGFAFDDITVTANAYAPQEPVATLFEDDFESGVFRPQWTITGTGNHRTEITNQQTPRGGYHMVMDVHASGNGRNEATLTLDVSGHQDLALKFWMKENSDEDQAPPTNPFTGGADFDGVAVSMDGNTWYEVQALRGTASTNTYQEFTVDLSAAASAFGFAPGAGFKIRFNHFDNSPWASGDGFAFDDIRVTGRPVQQLALSAPATLAEGGSAMAKVTLPAVRAVDTIVTLATNRPDGVTVPASITIPAGDTVSADFAISAAQDAFLTGNLPVQIVATAEGFRRSGVEMAILDDEVPAGFDLSLPATLAEGGTISGSVSMTSATLFDLTVVLSASPSLGLTLPSSVALPAGATSASFDLIKAENNTILEPASTTLTASLGAGSDSAVVTLTDNDSTAPLVITLPASVRESAAPLTGSVGFAPPVNVGTDLTVTLASSDTSELTVPASVVIPAGAGSVSFDITPVDDALSDGAVPVTITATAASLTGDTHEISVLDDEVHHFAFDVINSPQAALGAFPVTLRAQSIDNVTVSNFTGTATLSAANGGGAVGMSPSGTGAFVDGVWTGSVTLATPANAVILTANAAGGLTGSSNAFDVSQGARLTVAPSLLNVAMPEGEPPLSVPLTLTNPGGMTTNWNAEVIITGAVAKPPLASVLTNLNTDFASITALIPSRHDFTEGVTGNNISDGTGDMYDNGNYLSTNITTAGANLSYSDNVIASSANLGAGGQYFTRKHPGLFVFAADIAGLSHFEISGGLGADGSGTTDTAILTSTRGAATYKGYVKRVYNAGDPSVNHLIIVQDDPALTRTASTDTNNDQHRLSGLGAVTRIYHLLYASTSGGYINNTQTQAIMDAFLDSVTGFQWLSLATTSGSIPVAGSAKLNAVFNPQGLSPGGHNATLRFTSNDPAQPQLEMPVALTITPAVHHFVWSAISSSQAANVPFAATLTAQDASNATVTAFNGTAAVRALGPVAQITSGTGTNTTSFPFSAGSYYEMRTQSIYTPAEVGAAGRIQSIALDVATLPSMLTDFTIRLKHTSKTDYSATGSTVWENDGWTTVYRGNLSVPAAGWLALPLTTPFDYDGTSHLMVDFSFDNAAYGTSGSTRYSAASVPRTLYGGEYGYYGQPVTWSGTTPTGYSTTNLVNLRFSKRSLFPVAPGNVTFTNGVWSGTSSVGQSGAQVSLVATHNAKPAVTGESGVFNVTSVGSLALSIVGAGTEGGSKNATVTASVAPAADLTVTLVSSAPSVASPPATVTILAGQTSAAFTLTLPEDTLLEGTQTALITATAPGYDQGQAPATVNDNESTIVTVTLPASLMENTSSTAGQASVQLATPAAADLTVSLSSSLTTRLTVPASVVIPAGNSSASFILTAPNNSVIDGTQDAVITATLAGSAPATGTVQVTDNESRALSFVQFTTSISEGGSPSVSAGYISLSGSVAAPLTINLSSSDTSELNVSATVTVAAGSSTSGYFTLTPVNDTDFDGTQTVTLTASAASFTDGTRTVSVLDDDAHHFTVSAVASPQVRNGPFNVTFTAKDINNTTITAYAGSPVLTAQEGATALGVTPNTVTGFSSGVRTQSVTVQNEATAAVLTLTDATTAATGSSNAFVVGAGSLHHLTWDTIPTPQAPFTPFNVSISGRDAYENLVTSYAGSAQITAAENYNVTTAGTGTTSDWYPFGGYYPQNRCQMIYTQAEAGGVARKLQALAFDMTTPSASYPAVTLTNFTIRLKHTTKTDYNTSAVWESDGWTTVYQGTVNMNQTGWRQFNFTTPFDYNGTDRLMVDISSSQSSFVNRIEARSSFVSPYRVLYSFTSGAAPPTGWTGTGTALYYLPNLRLISFDPVAVTPSQTTAFTGGVWNGAISLAAPGSIVAMAMDSAAGVSGNSNAFTISSLGPLALSLPVSVIGESGGTVIATLSVGAAQGADIVVALTSTKPAAAAAVPASVTIPAGQTSVNFPVTVVNDTLLDGTQTTLITATAPGYGDGSASLAVEDDETTTISLTLPSTLAENAAATTGTVTLGAATGTDVILPLTSNDTTELVVPASVTILAGNTSATFAITPVDDAVIDLTQTVTVSTSMTGWTGGSSTIQITDNETASLSLNFTSSVTESTGTLTATLTSSNPVENATMVTLASTAATEATVPATATIAAGSSSTTFAITIIDDTDKDGSQTFAISAEAAGFITGTRNLTVTDNDVHNFLISAIGAAQIRNVPFNVTFTARDVNNVTITGYSGSPLLTASDDATALNVTPATISGFSSGVKSQSVTVGIFATNAVLTITDPITGGSGSSNAFVVTVGPASKFVWGSVPPPQVRDVAFPVTITAQDAAGNPVTSYTGSAALSAPAGSSSRNVGTGATTSAVIPFNTIFTKCRSQQVHLASEVGASGTFTSLAINVTSVPVAETLTDFTIRLKHTSRTGYSPDASDRIWETDGFTTVYQSNITVSTTGYLTFTFSTPFTYDGVSNLMVDYSYRMASNTSGRPTVIGTTRSNTRSIKAYTSTTTYGEPLTWAGTSPPAFADSLNTDIQLGVVTSYHPLSPASTSAFSNGIWSGNLTLGSTADSVTVTATDAALAGSSNSFEVIPTAFVLTAEPAFTGGLANTLAWNLPAAGLEYELERSATPDFATPVSSGFLAGSTTTFGGLVDGQTYHYRARMRRQGALPWTSDWFPPISSTQDASPPALSVPDLTTTTASTTLTGTATDATSGIANVTVAGSAANTSDSFASWSSALSGLGDGSNSITVIASDNAVPPNTTTMTAMVYRIASPGTDVNQDGINALLEHALGIPGGAANPRSMLPAAVTETDSGSGEKYLCMQFRRRIQRAGLSYIVETSSNLSTWDDTGANVIEKSVVPTGDGITETVTVRVTPAMNLGGAKFVRLRVTTN